MKNNKLINKINSKRSNRGISMDEHRTNKNTLENTPENIERWAKNPGHYDLKGVDTPKTRSVPVRKHTRGEDTDVKKHTREIVKKVATGGSGVPSVSFDKVEKKEPKDNFKERFFDSGENTFKLIRTSDYPFSRVKEKYFIDISGNEYSYHNDLNKAIKEYDKLVSDEKVRVKKLYSNPKYKINYSGSTWAGENPIKTEVDTLDKIFEKASHWGGFNEVTRLYNGVFLGNYENMSSVFNVDIFDKELQKEVENKLKSGKYYSKNALSIINNKSVETKPIDIILKYGAELYNIGESDLNVKDIYYLVDVKNNKIQITSHIGEKEHVINRYYDASNFEYMNKGVVNDTIPLKNKNIIFKKLETKSKENSFDGWEEEYLKSLDKESESYIIDHINKIIKFHKEGKEEIRYKILLDAGDIKKYIKNKIHLIKN